jgi:uncharacterized protein (TIGR00255 family)
MTGYGRAQAALGTQTLTVQVSSVNRKGLDLTMKLPDEWQAFESAVGEAVRKMAALAQAGGIRFEPTSELLWQIASAQRTGNKLPADEATAAILLDTLGEALRGLAAMRAKEGESLLIDFLTRLEKLHEAMEVIARRAPLVTAVYREQLHQRLRQAGLELDVSDERVLKEVALFADRCDVTEEITRLRSHFGQLKTLLRSTGEIGRKTEFILQEIGREIHTIGSKANDLAISQQVIEFKNELERVREQIANVE